ncbi:MAG: nuclear transport factor 2 family protein [Pseudomonadota bacterium]
MDIDTADIAAMIAHERIRQVIYRLARSIDRCDKPLLASCFHEGATDDHGIFKGSADDFCDWVMVELQKFERTQHFIGNIIITLDGNKAATEAYFIAHHVMTLPDGDGKKIDMIAAGRYLDQFECRDGAWKIIHRHAVYDWNRADDSTDTWGDPAIAAVLMRGTRGADDTSYDVIG